MLRAFFTKKWLPMTIFAIVAVVVTIRLGIWQLDRLEQRREFNSRVNAQISQPVLELDALHVGDDIENMEYREVIVNGVYDHTQEIAIRNQHWQNQWGFHLVTPLIISGTDVAVLVDRGWIPADAADPSTWALYAEPGIVEIRGVIRASKVKADFGGRSDPTQDSSDEQIAIWNFVNIDGISQQTTHKLLPGYIQQAPESSRVSLPYRTQPTLDLSEGPHQGYAIQWFTFAAIAFFGYPLLVFTKEKKRKNYNSLEREKKGDKYDDRSFPI